MPGRRRTHPWPGRSRLRAVVLAAAVVLLIAAAVTGVYKVLTGGNIRHAGATSGARPVTTPGRSATSPTPVSTASCAGAPNTPGGPDPWGGCWPGSSNTGPQTGTVLTRYTGPVRPDGSCMI